eukprot:TRINITY_DN75837_c0_g1_i1.p1 TRINITY_DN75837_c0_g1~~TRINITY_DN75837_c0_g1_i1.p1  ORF type:complete len:561 (+),score=107.09 TRINITY_DN75837_c0_g1_i1:153-1835(+)
MATATQEAPTPPLARRNTNTPEVHQPPRASIGSVPQISVSEAASQQPVPDASPRGVERCVDNAAPAEVAQWMLPQVQEDGESPMIARSKPTHITFLQGVETMESTQEETTAEEHSEEEEEDMRVEIPPGAELAEGGEELSGASSDETADVADVAVEVEIEFMPPLPQARGLTATQEAAATAAASARAVRAQYRCSDFAVALKSAQFGMAIRVLMALIVQPFGSPIPVRYSMKFRLYLAFCSFGMLCWLINFALVVKPAIESPSVIVSCKLIDGQLRHNAASLCVYSVTFVVIRSVTFIPRVALYLAQLRPETQGVCKMYTIHLFTHGPLYILSVSSLLFWCQLLQSPVCAEANEDMYHILKLQASYSCILSAFLIGLVYWHTRVIGNALSSIEFDRRRAPPETMDKLPTIAYDVEVFGDEDGKRYPAECSICLLEFQAGDAIKVTPCDHAFHKQCLGGWLRLERTCALCRQDVTTSRLAPGRLPERPRFSPRSSEVRPAVTQSGSQADESDLAVARHDIEEQQPPPAMDALGGQLQQAQIREQHRTMADQHWVGARVSTV